jgi:hypothetical protein
METEKKYLYLHRIHVLAIMYILINLASKILKSPEVALLFFLVMAFYLIFLRRLDSILFRKKFHQLTLVIALGSMSAVGSGMADIVFSRFEFIGTVSTLLVFFILFNSIFILMKAFKLEPKDILSDKKDSKETSHDL